MMKHFLLLTITLMLFFLGMKTFDCSSLHVCEKGSVVVCMEDDHVSNQQPGDGYFLTDSAEIPMKQMAVSDSQSLARQLRSFTRNQRSICSCSSFYAKASAWKRFLSRMDALSYSFSQTYNSLPRPCWEYSSDHYIYAMRRILI